MSDPLKSQVELAEELLREAIEAERQAEEDEQEKIRQENPLQYGYGHETDPGYDEVDL
jgi:hypothetical protein